MVFRPPSDLEMGQPDTVSRLYAHYFLFSKCLMSVECQNLIIQPHTLTCTHHISPNGGAPRIFSSFSAPWSLWMVLTTADCSLGMSFELSPPAPLHCPSSWEPQTMCHGGGPAVGIPESNCRWNWYIPCLLPRQPAKTQNTQQPLGKNSNNNPRYSGVFF